MTPTTTFTCSICGEPSLEICVYCTKDACGNHICDKCKRCSDCCECEVRLDESPATEHHQQPAVQAVAAEVPAGTGQEALETGPEPPQPDAPPISSSEPPQ